MPLELGKFHERAFYSLLERILDETANSADFSIETVTTSGTFEAATPPLPTGEKWQIARIRADITTTAANPNDRNFEFFTPTSPHYGAPVLIGPGETRTLFWVPGATTWTEFSPRGELIVGFSANDDMLKESENVTVRDSAVSSADDTINLTVRYYRRVTYAPGS